MEDEQLALGFPPDPIWTESNWDNSVPSVKFFQVHNSKCFSDSPCLSVVQPVLILQ